MAKLHGKVGERREKIELISNKTIKENRSKKEIPLEKLKNEEKRKSFGKFYSFKRPEVFSAS